jgi:hypothetical protein
VNEKVIWGLVALGYVYAGLGIWWAWIAADYRGWKRGFKSAQDIWKSGFYELLELQRKRD